jgi:hypothetical protein
MRTCCGTHYEMALEEMARRLASRGIYPGGAMAQVKMANPVVFWKAVDGLTGMFAQGTPCAERWTGPLEGKSEHDPEPKP